MTANQPSLADRSSGPDARSVAAFVRSTRGQAALTVLALIALTLTAVHPYMFGSLPRTDDLLQHLYRLIALDYSIRYGDLWPRYLPTMLYGYGEPLFNYYSPLSLYLFEILHLAGLRFQTALLAGLAAYILAGTGGAYLLGKSWGGPLAGIGAAVGYTYAPYTIYNALQRGAVGEVAALALLPWVLWAFRQVAEAGRRGDFALALILTCLLILMHNITALLAGALIAVYGLYVWWTAPNPPRTLVHMALAGILALGITAFYWLPALAEASYVQLDRTRVGVQNPPDAPEFYDEFQRLDQTFGPPQPTDLTWFNPPVQRSMSWPQIALALSGLILLAFRRNDPEARTRLGLMILLLGLIALMLFMTTRASGPVWAAVPLIRFFQFPWRMLGPASLLLALMAGIGLAEIAERIRFVPLAAGWAVLAVLAMIVYAMPWLYRLYIPDPAASTVIDSQNYERQSGQIGGTARGEYAPIWSEELPDPNRLTPLFAQNEVIPRLQPNPALTVTQAAWGPTSGQLTLSAPADTRLVFDWLFFPGWWATIDGQPTPITPTPKRGLISLTLPSGEHMLALGFGPTPLRLNTLIASGVCVILAALLVGSVSQPWPSSEIELRPKPLRHGMLAILASTLLAGAAIFALKTAVIDNIQSPIKRARFASGLEAGLQTPLRLTYGGQVTLLGYDLESSRVASGDSAHLALYWQPASGMIPNDYTSALYLRDPAGSILAESTEFYPGGWATTHWVPGFYVRQPLDLAVPPGTAPGTYTLSVSMYFPGEQKNLEITDAAGNSRGVMADIGTVEVSAPARPPTLAEVGIGAGKPLPPLNARLLPEITLLSANAPPASAEVGQQIALLTVWRAEAHPAQPYSYALVWLDANDQVAGISMPAAPVTGYPTDQWQGGEVWRGLARLTIPGRLRAGSYTLAVQLLDAQGHSVGEHAVIGAMQVTTPQRTFTPPTRSVTSDISWDNGIALIGYDISQPAILRGRSLLVNLYWLPRSDITTSLTLFVHLVDSDGKIAAQVDTVPAAGARPTSGWMPGEIITDYIQLNVSSEAPAGRYWIRVGWYDAATGKRVGVQGGDFWLLPDIIRVMSGS